MVLGMRAVVQRVKSAAVRVEGKTVGAIDKGLVVYLGVGAGDTEAEAALMSRKILGLRVFENDEGKMSLDVRDVNGAVLVVSQFTLYGDVRKGRRPSFTSAAPPDEAKRLYEQVAQTIENDAPVATGQFQADMLVDTQVDGPVTILIDTSKAF